MTKPYDGELRCSFLRAEERKKASTVISLAQALHLDSNASASLYLTHVQFLAPGSSGVTWPLQMCPHCVLLPRAKAESARLGHTEQRPLSMAFGLVTLVTATLLGNDVEVTVTTT